MCCGHDKKLLSQKEIKFNLRFFLYCNACGLEEEHIKKIKKLSALMLVLVLSLSFVACGGSKSITGTWTVDGTDADISKLELKDDGTGSISLGDSISLNITYTTEKDKLTITMSYLGQTESDEYTYTLKKGKLTLTDSSQTQITFVKQ